MITFNYTLFFLFVIAFLVSERGFPCLPEMTRLMRDSPVPNKISQVQPGDNSLYYRFVSTNESSMPPAPSLNAAGSAGENR